MNAFLVIFVGVCIVLWVGAELHTVWRRRRHERGEWQHQATVSRVREGARQ